MACDAEDWGFQMLNDEEMVTSVQEESDPVNDQTDEDEDNTTKVARVHQMLSRFLAMEWFEQKSDCCPTQLLLLKRIGDLAAKKRRCTMV
ncbi:hypothetical protein TNCV_1806901 [Trichonephila clavipes]|nr:hypothetical protein TNCV_1806901 [Trichonephila clavipes]